MDDSDLKKRLREKYYSDQDTTNFDVLDFVSAFGSPLHALMYSELFWPDFVEYNDMIFLKTNIEDNEFKLRVTNAFRKEENIKKIEQDFNLTEVPSMIFGTKAAYEMTEEEDRALAERLAEMWKCRLQTLFPQRRFVVKVINPEETGGEVGLLFYQE